MPEVTAERFLELVRKSGLVDHGRLAETLAAWEQPCDVAILTDTARLADGLVEAGLLTRWQCDKMLEGKHRGFFLGKYRLLKHLGSGGMSHVYLAEHTLMQRRVAIKVLPSHRVEDSSYLARFRLEAQAAAALDHRNIVRVYDIDNDGKTHYIVMEYIEGRDLQALVREDGPLDYDRAADFIRQAAEGLEHAHVAGLIHRDIKPANLLLDPKGEVKILDMGLARFSDDSRSSLTIAHDESVLGTVDYLPPEQAINSHTADRRADIYSLGCTLYYLLTGHPPFPEGSVAERIDKHIKKHPPSISIERPDAPEELLDICTKMMAKSPSKRFATAGQLAAVLSAWLAARGYRSASASASGSLSLPTANQAAPSGGLPPPGGASGLLPPPRPDRLPPPRPQPLPSTSDTLSSWERETIKGPPSRKDGDRAGGSAAKSGTKIQPAPAGGKGSSVIARGLPVAKPLDDSSGIGASGEYVFERSALQGGSQTSRSKAGSSKPGASRPGMSKASASKVGTPSQAGKPTVGSSIQRAKALEPKSPSSSIIARQGSEPLGKRRKFADLPWWLWSILGVGLLAVIALVIILLRRS